MTHTKAGRPTFCFHCSGSPLRWRHRLRLWSRMRQSGPGWAKTVFLSCETPLRISSDLTIVSADRDTPAFCRQLAGLHRNYFSFAFWAAMASVNQRSSSRKAFALFSLREGLMEIFLPSLPSPALGERGVRGSKDERQVFSNQESFCSAVPMRLRPSSIISMEVANERRRARSSPKASPGTVTTWASLRR